MYKIIFTILIAMTIMSPVFGQQKEELDTSKQLDWEIYAAIAGISVALLGVFLSDHQTRKSNKIAKDSFDLLRKSTEADLLLRLNDSIYRSDEGKKIIEALRLKRVVLENAGGFCR